MLKPMRFSGESSRKFENSNTAQRTEMSSVPQAEENVPMGPSGVFM